MGHEARKAIAMRIERALLICILIGLSAPALALEAPSASPSPASESKGADLPPLKPAPDEDMGVGSMKLLAPGIGWAEHSVSHDSSDYVEATYYWTTDNGKHWKNITPRATGKEEIADFFFLDTHRGWAVFDLSAAEQNESQTKLPLTLATTTNAGATWSKTPLTLRLGEYFSKDNLSDLNDIEVSRIAFADPLHGWLQLAFRIGMHGHGTFLLVTSDGGKTWKEADSYQGPNSSDDMVLVTPDENTILRFALNDTGTDPESERLSSTFRDSHRVQGSPLPPAAQAINKPLVNAPETSGGWNTPSREVNSTCPRPLMPTN
jgi:hypothetical protein